MTVTAPAYAPSMRWELANRMGGSWYGYDGARLVGQIVEYDVPAGFTVFVLGRRVGVYEEWGQAVQAADDEWSKR